MMRLLLVGLLSMLGSMRVAVAGECVVRGEQVALERVRVRPSGAPPFFLGLQEARVSARIPARSDRPVRLTIEGDVSFEAEVKRLWLTTTTEVETSDGLVRVRPGAHLIPSHVSGGLVVGTLVVEAGDVLEGEDKAPEESLSNVHLPCAALSLDWSADDTGEDEHPPASARWWRLKGQGSTVKLHAAPKAKSTARVLAAPHCEGCLVLRELEARGDWLKVERPGEGVVVHGWVRRSQLERMEDDVGFGRGAVCTGDHDQGQAFGEADSRPTGTVQVTAGTALFARPGRGAWARTRRPLTLTVRFGSDKGWVEVTGIPGLAGNEWSAWLPRAAISVPAGEGD